MTGLGQPSDRELPGRPDPGGLEAQVLLGELRARMFRRTASPAIGRFRLLHAIGRGAHGTVFEAHDAALDRRVAIKVLRRELHGHDRLLREARALAQLTHPHVVEIYAAGRLADGVWIAMELVRGATLEQWARQHPVGTRARFDEARRWLVQAGLGLAAAHDRGIVHRDVKPANVLLGDDGRARVVDFGLAREAQPLEVMHGEQGAPKGRPPDATATGGLVGTLPYMSPEQLRGTGVDARSDQFNFAAAAWQVVFGRLPFLGDDPPARLRAIGRAPDTPHGAAVPRWFRRALVRGLAADPEDRFPSMLALVQALQPPSRRRSLLLGAGAVLVASSALVLVPSTHGRCDAANAHAELAELWSPARRDAVARGLIAAGRSTAEVEHIEQAVRDFGTRWAAQYAAACDAARDETTVLDVRMACLRHAMSTVDALLLRFGTASVALATRATAAVRSLPDPSRCAAPSDDVVDGDVADALRQRLAGVMADRLLGDDVGAAERGEAIVAEARAADLSVVLGDALELVGRAWSELEDERSQGALVEAHDIAVRHGDDDRAARRATLLARQHVYAKRPDAAQKWQRHADAALSRIDADAVQRAALMHVECAAHLHVGRVVEAVAACERARDRLADATTDDPELQWLIGHDLALAYDAAGRSADGEATMQRLYRNSIAELGADHPRVATAALTLARNARAHGDRAGAIDYAREAVEIFVRVYGATHTLAGAAYMHLGALLHDDGDLDGADDAFVHALAAGDGRRDQWRGRVLRRLAELRADQARYDEAVELSRASLGIMQEQWTHGRPEVAAIQRTLGTTLLEHGDLVQGERELRRALELDMRAPFDRDITRTWLALGDAAERAARVDDARVRYLRALATCAGDDDGRSACVVAMARLAQLAVPITGRAEAASWLAVATALAEGLAPSSPARAELVAAGTGAPPHDEPTRARLEHARRELDAYGGYAVREARRRIDARLDDAAAKRRTAITPR